MLELEHPWWLLALPVPLLVWWLVPPYERRLEALRVPFLRTIADLLRATPRSGAVVEQRGLVRSLLLVALWLCVVAALSKPMLLGKPVTMTKSARDLLLAVDLSGSMATQDMQAASAGPQTRLAAVKEVVGEFAERRKGDRLGLIVFGAAPFVQVPFTLDTLVVRQLLDESSTGMAGNQTVLGDAIGLAIRLFSRSQASNRVLILLTDGNDTGSAVPPEQAARIAASRGITIHVVGVGDPRTAGEARLNEEVLEQIARLTGGAYFHANDRGELSQIYARLDKLERIEFESKTFQPKRSVFYWPLSVGLGLVLLFNGTLLLGALRTLRSANRARSTPEGASHA